MSTSAARERVVFQALLTASSGRGSRELESAPMASHNQEKEEEKKTWFESLLCYMGCFRAGYVLPDPWTLLVTACPVGAAALVRQEARAREAGNGLPSGCRVHSPLAPEQTARTGAPWVLRATDSRHLGEVHRDRASLC